MRQVQIQVSHYELGHLAEEEEEFAIHWPAGFVVRDERAKTQYVVTGPAKPLSDDVIANEYSTGEQWLERNESPMTIWLVVLQIVIIAGAMAYWMSRRKSRSTLE